MLNDYIFLTFLAGNDFVLSLPFLKIKKNALYKIINIYQEIKEDFDDYLVKFDFRKDKKPSINLDFLKKYMKKDMKMKDDWMKNDVQKEIDKQLTGYVDERQKEFESKLSRYEKIKNRYTHSHVVILNIHYLKLTKKILNH